VTCGAGTYDQYESTTLEQGDLIEAVLRNYDRLPEELQKELPLKRIWALVSEE